MSKTIEHWFNHQWGMARRDVYLLRTETGWQALGRRGGTNGREFVYYFDHEDDARTMVEAFKQHVPAQLANWALITERQFGLNP
jgi:hypothetical protein